MHYVDRIKQLVGVEEEEPEEPSIIDRIFGSFELSWNVRLYSFVIMAVASLFFFIIAALFSQGIIFNPAPFAIFFTIGNALAIGSTFFLIGPTRQFKMILKPDRLIAIVIYLIVMVLTLFSSLYLHNSILVFLCIIIQLLALVWYVLSYIPMARMMVIGAFRGMFNI